MDWDAISAEATDVWLPLDVKPAEPGIYQVQVPMLDPQSGAQLGVVERFAQWTGAWWTCWATSPERAQTCQWRGPLAGYRWKAG